MPPAPSVSPGSSSASIERALERILAAWEKTSHTLDFLLEREFGHKGLTSEAKAQITERASNWARGRGAARYLLAQKLNKNLASLPPPLRRRLEIAVCRLLFEQRTPPAIQVSQAVEEVKATYGKELGGLANAVLRSLAEKPLPWPPAETDPVGYLAASTSHPAWIVERWLQRWGYERTHEQLAWDNLRPEIWLRWNWLRGDLQQTEAFIGENQLEVQADQRFAGYFHLLTGYFPTAAAVVEKGYFSVQDPSASLAVELLQPTPGQKILDLCAAPGGKTTLIAQRSRDSADIMAVDSSPHRLGRLQTSLERLNIKSVKLVSADGRKYAPSCSADEQFDAVLLDVPCSGLGVLARRADLRWRRKPEDLPQLVALQKELIRAASRCIRPGGALVYSTCTIEPEENQDIIHNFLEYASNFALDDRLPLFPDFAIAPGEFQTCSPRDRIDGVYCARLIRKN